MAAFQRTILCRAAKCRQRARGIRIGVLDGKALVGGTDREEASLSAAGGVAQEEGKGWWVPNVTAVLAWGVGVHMWNALNTSGLNDTGQEWRQWLVSRTGAPAV